MTIPPLDLSKVNVTPDAKTPKEETESARHKRIEEIKNYDFKLLQDAVIERRKRSFTI